MNNLLGGGNSSNLSILKEIEELKNRIRRLESNGFSDHGRTTDPDTIEIPGMYYMYGGTLHAPEPGNGYLLMHFNAGGRVAQIALVNGVTDNYYIRTKIAGQSNYSVWRKLTTT